MSLTLMHAFTAIANPASFPLFFLASTNFACSNASFSATYKNAFMSGLSFLIIFIKFFTLSTAESFPDLIWSTLFLIDILPVLFLHDE